MNVKNTILEVNGMGTLFGVGLQHTVGWFGDNWDRIEASPRFGPGVSSAVREMAAAREGQDG